MNTHNAKAQQVTLGWSRIKPLDIDLPLARPIGATTPIDTPTTENAPLIVNVWASYCVPCRHELPLLENVARAGDIQVLGLTRDFGAGAAKQSLARARVTYPNYQDADASFAVQLDGRIPLNAIPSSVLVTAGKAVAVHIGAFKTENDIMKGLEYVP